VIVILAAASLVNLVVVVVQTAARGRLLDLFRNTGVTLVALANVRRLGTGHVIATGQSFPPSIARPLPNAVSMMLATTGVVVVWVSRVGAG
jgi:hypothetical protein